MVGDQLRALEASIGASVPSDIRTYAARFGVWNGLPRAFVFQEHVWERANGLNDVVNARCVKHRGTTLSFAFSNGVDQLLADVEEATGALRFYDHEEPGMTMVDSPVTDIAELLAIWVQRSIATCHGRGPLARQLWSVDFDIEAPPEIRRPERALAPLRVTEVTQSSETHSRYGGPCTAWRALVDGMPIVVYELRPPTRERPCSWMFRADESLTTGFVRAEGWAASLRATLEAADVSFRCRSQVPRFADEMSYDEEVAELEEQLARNDA